MISKSIWAYKFGDILSYMIIASVTRSFNIIGYILVQQTEVMAQKDAIRNSLIGLLNLPLLFVNV